MTVYKPLDIPGYEEYDRACVHMLRHEYLQAEEQLNMGLEKSLKDNNKERIAFYYSALGTLSLQQNDYQSAVDYYQKASSEDADNDLYVISVARTYLYYLNQPQSALDALSPLFSKELFNSDIQRHLILNLKGMCLLRLNKNEESVAIMDQLTKINFDELFKTRASFDLAEELARKGYGIDKIKKYLKSALSIANKYNDTYHIKLLDKIDDILKRLTKGNKSAID